MCPSSRQNRHQRHCRATCANAIYSPSKLAEIQTIFKQQFASDLHWAAGTLLLDHHGLDNAETTETEQEHL